MEFVNYPYYGGLFPEYQESTISSLKSIKVLKSQSDCCLQKDVYKNELEDKLEDVCENECDCGKDLSESAYISDMINQKIGCIVKMWEGKYFIETNNDNTTYTFYPTIDFTDKPFMKIYLEHDNNSKFTYVAIVTGYFEVDSFSIGNFFEEFSVENKSVVYDKDNFIFLSTKILDTPMVGNIIACNKGKMFARVFNISDKIDFIEKFTGFKYEIKSEYSNMIHTYHDRLFNQNTYDIYTIVDSNEKSYYYYNMLKAHNILIKYTSVKKYNFENAYDDATIQHFTVKYKDQLVISIVKDKGDFSTIYSSKIKNPETLETILDIKAENVKNLNEPIFVNPFDEDLKITIFTNTFRENLKSLKVLFPYISFGSITRIDDSNVKNMFNYKNITVDDIFIDIYNNQRRENIPNIKTIMIDDQKTVTERNFVCYCQGPYTIKCVMVNDIIKEITLKTSRKYLELNIPENWTVKSYQEETSTLLMEKITENNTKHITMNLLTGKMSVIELSYDKIKNQSILTFGSMPKYLCNFVYEGKIKMNDVKFEDFYSQMGASVEVSWSDERSDFVDYYQCGRDYNVFGGVPYYQCGNNSSYKKTSIEKDKKTGKTISMNMSKLDQSGKPIESKEIKNNYLNISKYASNKYSKTGYYGYKAALSKNGDFCIVKLKIPADALVACDNLMEKYRASKCVVLAINKVSINNGKMFYVENTKDTECPICLDNTASYAASPCNHRLCEDCWLKISREHNNKCPFCVQNIRSVTKIIDDESKEEITVAYSFIYNSDLAYVVGQEISIDNFDRDLAIPCGPGIHFQLEVSEVFKWFEYANVKDISNISQIDETKMQYINNLVYRRMEKDIPDIVDSDSPSESTEMEVENEMETEATDEMEDIPDEYFMDILNDFKPVTHKPLHPNPWMPENIVPNNNNIKINEFMDDPTVTLNDATFNQEMDCDPFKDISDVQLKDLHATNPFDDIPEVKLKNLNASEEKIEEDIMEL